MVFSVSIAMLTIAGILVLLAFVNPFNDENESAHHIKPAKPQVVALVTSDFNCRWASRSEDKIRGKSLLSGDEIELHEGAAEIMFTSGAKVVLQGPSVICLESENAGRLYSGRLTATVPKKAIGFKIHTPYAAVTDLGTRFAVSSDGKKGAYVFVKDGKVEVGYSSNASADRQVKKLKAGESFRVFPSGEVSSVRPLKDEISTFVFSVIKHDEKSYPQAVLSDHPLAYWRLNEKSGAIARDSSGGNHHGKYEAGVLLGAKGPLKNSNSTSVKLDGKTGFVSLPKLGTAKQLTVEAWVNVENYSHEMMMLISTNKLSGSPSGSLRWQFNTKSELYLTYKSRGWRQCYFPIQIAKRRWYHVVFTHDSRKKEVQMFVNGKLIETKKISNLMLVNLGDSLIGGGYHDGKRWLDGSVAEVAIYKNILTPTQIQKHYQASLGQASVEK